MAGGPDFLLSTDSSEPVSYTHLDVYKRQVYGWYDRLAIQHALATQLGIDLCINLAA